MFVRKAALGEQHPAYAASLNNLAGLDGHRGEFWKAESLYLQAMLVCKSALGVKHPAHAGSLNSLAALYAEWARSRR